MASLTVQLLQAKGGNSGRAANISMAHCSTLLLLLPFWPTLCCIKEQLPRPPPPPLSLLQPPLLPALLCLPPFYLSLSSSYSPTPVSPSSSCSSSFLPLSPALVPLQFKPKKSTWGAVDRHQQQQQQQPQPQPVHARPRHICCHSLWHVAAATLTVVGLTFWTKTSTNNSKAACLIFIFYSDFRLCEKIEKKQQQNYNL